MLLRDFILAARSSLAELYGQEEAVSLVSVLCGEVLGVSSYAHVLAPETVVPDDRLPLLESSFSRLVSGEPLQYVLGHAEFCGRRFNVSPSVLIPRPETELMCRMILTELLPLCGLSSPSVMDLCTGSGCIAWTLSLSLPDASVTGMDISDEALQVASSQPFSGNAPSFFKGDLLRLSDFASLGKFDVIVSNPPYVKDSERALMRKNVLDFEPCLALFVPDDNPLVFYDAVASFSVEHLAPGGFGIVEINEALGKETADVFRSAGFGNVSVREDLSGKPRYVVFLK